MNPILILLLALTTYSSLYAESKQLVVYTHRNEQLIKPLFDEFKKETGINVKFLTGDPGALIQRLKAEGVATPADLFISVDAGTLWLAEKEGLFQVTQSKLLDDRVPKHLRDPNGNWFGLSLRARTLFYNKEKVKPSELSDYANLALPAWKGRLCLRTSKKVYNHSLVAMLIDEHGVKKTEEIVEGWVANLASDVFENDTKLLEAIERGDCHVGIANTYYLGRLIEAGKVKNVAVHFPLKTHLNISGGGILRHSKNKAQALQLLEWLTTPKAQKLFADSNMEYAVTADVPAAKVIEDWGRPTASEWSLYRAGELQRQAMMLMDRANYR